LRFCDIETLKIDRFDAGIFIAKNSLRESNRSYDNVVAATSWIGPRVPAAAE